MSNFPAHFKRHMIVPTAIESINEALQYKFCDFRQYNATGMGGENHSARRSRDIPTLTPYGA